MVVMVVVAALRVLFFRVTGLKVDFVKTVDQVDLLVLTAVEAVVAAASSVAVVIRSPTLSSSPENYFIIISCI